MNPDQTYTLRHFDMVKLPRRSGLAHCLRTYREFVKTEGGEIAYFKPVGKVRVQKLALPWRIQTYENELVWKIVTYQSFGSLPLLLNEFNRWLNSGFCQSLPRKLDDCRAYCSATLSMSDSSAVKFSEHRIL